MDLTWKGSAKIFLLSSNIYLKLIFLAKLVKSFNTDLLELIRNRRGWYINSVYSVTEPINFCTADHFHSFKAMKGDLHPANVEAVDS